MAAILFLALFLQCLEQLLNTDLEGMTDCLEDHLSAAILPGDSGPQHVTLVFSLQSPGTMADVCEG